MGERPTNESHSELGMALALPALFLPELSNTEHLSISNRYKPVEYRKPCGVGGSSMPMKITVNGKPATVTKVKNELERSVLDAIIAEVAKTIRSTASFEELQQITLHVIGSDLSNLAFGLEGPEEIVNRARAGLTPRETPRLSSPGGGEVHDC